MDELVGKALELGGGWTLTKLHTNEPMDQYRLCDENGWFRIIDIDPALPNILYQLNLMRLIEQEMERGEIMTMAGGGEDVRSEPDGT